MLNQLLRSFVWGYGKTLGRKAAHKTGFLAVPLLILVAYIILNQIGIVSLDTNGLGVHSILEAFR